jgi:hypothetical protein
MMEIKSPILGVQNHYVPNVKLPHKNEKLGSNTSNQNINE